MKEMATHEYFKALYPEELVARYRSGERDFEGINLLRAELEAIVGPTVVPFDSWYVAPALVSEGKIRGPLCPLRADYFDVEHRFEWDVDGRFCPVELGDLPETRDLSGLDFRGINLSGAYLYPVDLAGADLREAVLKRTVIIDGRFSGVDFSRADLRDARLRHADLTGANFYMARLDRCGLHGAILKGATLARAKLRKAALSGADLTGASIRHAQLENTSLFGTCLRDVDLDGCDLSTCGVGGLRISLSQRDQFLKSLRIKWE